MALFDKPVLKSEGENDPNPPHDPPEQKASCIVFNIYCGCGCEHKKKEK